MDFSTEQLRTALLSLIAFIVAVTVHEFGHAWMANRLGDDLPRTQGRLTLSPLAHIDLFGTILMPLVAALAPAGFPFLAWGKPVMTNPKHYRISPRLGDMLVSLMGPLMNLVLAIVASLALWASSRAGVLTISTAQAGVEYFLVLNLRLMFFNLLPIPPLDGAPVLAGVLPERLQIIPRFLRRYGFYLFFVLLLTPGLRWLMRPADRLTAAWVDVLMRHVHV
ncbi:MAG TPA: site-2 protease family protein [Polyangia bacterium]|nr:site-2 protease family protein [Polyangia bacterium]